jgi:hypothetical protein
MSQVPVRFISGVRLGGSPREVLASIVGFNGVVTWLGDLLKGNISTIDILIYEVIEEVSNFVATVSFSLDVPLWCSSGVLQQNVDCLISQAWHEAFVPVEEEEVPRWTPISSPVGLSPLDTTPIVWEYPSEGICMLDLFGGISTSLVTLLEIWHFAIVLCNWFPVACDTCNWKFAQLRTTSCMKFAVACDSRIIQVHTVGLYNFIHPYSILAVGRATTCNYRGCVHTALYVN